ncbi:MAG: SUMF1/EgtB/PvdO family nonheme iron enzyme [Kofleriaceae bacterium]
MRARPAALTVMVALAACGTTPRFSPAQPVVAALELDAPYRGGAAAMSAAADAQMVAIPASRSIAGSTPEERAQAVDDWAAGAGRDGAPARSWFEQEEDRHIVEVPGFRIDLLPVTNAAYAEFVADGGAPAPSMDAETWKRQGFQQDWATQVARFVWPEGRPPPGREDHPVVLVSWDDAARYCAWRGHVVGAARRLPSAHEFEKAARGDAGLAYPWGQAWSAERVNSAVGGPGDTVAVGSNPGAISPTGVLDLAGNVFQWTGTPWPPDQRATAKMTVKGSAWDDYPGLGRGASWHGRPRGARHVIVGFRCAGPM